MSLKMAALREKLQQLESRLQTLIEGSAARLFAGADLSAELAESLAESMRAAARPLPGGGMLAPDRYDVSMHPAHVHGLRQQDDLLAEMARGLEAAAAAAGMTFSSPPVIRLHAAGDVLPRQCRVQAQISAPDLGETMGMPAAGEPPPALPANAYLVVDGVRLFALNASLVNIGRREDNHLVIADQRVSRLHAQLRAIQGRFVLFDLGSAGGVFVNDQRVSQRLLFPGDVISLAGVPLVFGQDDSRLGDTQQVVPPRER
ncbi:MAG: FHA domain-containing protein [Chloroflexi bacterium]|nr:FHA domain-containing protein [Chloroflexota bacterium]